MLLKYKANTIPAITRVDECNRELTGVGAVVYEFAALIDELLWNKISFIMPVFLIMLFLVFIFQLQLLRSCVC